MACMSEKEARLWFPENLCLWELCNVEHVTPVCIKSVIHTGQWFYLREPQCNTQLSALGALGTGLVCGVIVVSDPWYSMIENGAKTIECHHFTPAKCSRGSVIGISLKGTQVVSLKAQLGTVHVMPKVRIGPWMHLIDRICAFFQIFSDFFLPLQFLVRFLTVFRRRYYPSFFSNRIISLFSPLQDSVTPL